MTGSTAISGHPEMKKWTLADEYVFAQEWCGENYWPNEDCGGLPNNLAYIRYVENAGAVFGHGGWRFDRMRADIRVLTTYYSLLW